MLEKPNSTAEQGNSAVVQSTSPRFLILSNLRELLLNERLAWVVLLSTWFVTFVAWKDAVDVLERSQQTQFQNRTLEVIEAITKRMQRYEQVLRGGVALFDSVGRVDRATWRQYVTSLKVQESYPGIQGIGFSLVIPAEQLNAHSRAVRAEGFPDYAVRPAGRRDLYTSIIYLEPFDWRNRRAFGFDMFSESNRHAAMVRARDTGETSISAKVKLVQETEEKPQAGMLMYLPCYAKGKPHETEDERRVNLLGYVYSPFRMHDLMTGILGSTRSSEERDLDIEVYDGDSISADSLLYDDDEIPTGLATPIEGRLTKTQKISLYGHDWTVYFVTRPGFHAAFDYTKPWLILVSGGMLGLLTAGLIYIFATQRRRAMVLANHMNAEALASNEKLRSVTMLQNSILNATSYAIISTDTAGTIKSFNAGAVQMLGYLPEEIVDRKTPDAFHDPAEIRSYLEQVSRDTNSHIECGFDAWVALIRAEQTIEHEFSLVSKLGARIPVYQSVYPLRNEAGDIVGYLEVATDISARKLAEQGKRDEETKLAAILDNVLDAIITIDEQGTIETCNRSTQSIFGYDPHELIGKNVKVLMPDPYYSEHDSYLHKYVASRQKRVIGARRQVVARRKSGEIFPIELVVTEIWLDNRRFFTGMIRDVTERVKVDKMKSEFISTVSHELRTPLTSIRGSLGLVAGGMAGQLSEQAKTLVDIAYKNSERLILLVNDILDMEKIESGKMNFTFKPCEINSLVEQSLEANKGYAKQFGVSFEFTPSSALLEVNLDEDRFMQVLANLLSNAVKFSSAGMVVRISVLGGDGTVKISVTDSGPGIPEDFQEKIFKKFSQADSSDTRAKGGSGLGLSISKAIVEKMGGHIGFISARDVGTTFYVEFPQMEPSRRRDGGGQGTNANEILLCSANDLIVQEVGGLLQRAGYTVRLAATPLQAEQIIRHERCEAMVLDFTSGNGWVDFLGAGEDSQHVTRGIPTLVLAASAVGDWPEQHQGVVVLHWSGQNQDEGRLAELLRHVLAAGHAAPLILHVEDDPDILKVVASLIGSEGRVMAVPTLAEARKVIRSQPLDLVILDVALPDGSGLELLQTLEATRDSVPVIIFSATEMNVEVIGRVQSALVKSRTSNEQLLAEIKQALQKFLSEESQKWQKS